MFWTYRPRSASISAINANKLLRTAIGAVALLCAAVLSACTQDAANGADEVAGDGPYRITTTVGMVRDIAEQVAGDKGEVSLIMRTKPLSRRAQGFTRFERFAS